MYTCVEELASRLLSLQLTSKYDVIHLADLLSQLSVVFKQSLSIAILLTSVIKRIEFKHQLLHLLIKCIELLLDVWRHFGESPSSTSVHDIFPLSTEQTVSFQTRVVMTCIRHFHRLLTHYLMGP